MRDVFLIGRDVFFFSETLGPGLPLLRVVSPKPPNRKHRVFPLLFAGSSFPSRFPSLVCYPDHPVVRLVPPQHSKPGRPRYPEAEP